MIKRLAFALCLLADPSLADDFKITIADKPSLVGITMAREAYNAALPADSKPIDTDEAYLQMIVGGAARSYAKQYGTDTDYDTAIADLQAKRDAVAAKGKK